MLPGRAPPRGAGAAGLGAAGLAPSTFSTLGAGLAAGLTGLGAAGLATGLGSSATAGLGALGPGLGAAGLAPSTGAGLAAGLAGLGAGLAAFLAPGLGASLLAFLAPSPSTIGAKCSRTRRATGGSTALEAALTNSPWSFSQARMILLVTFLPEGSSSLASSCTRGLATILLFQSPT